MSTQTHTQPNFQSSEQLHKIPPFVSSAAQSPALCPVSNCRSQITSNLSDVQFYEPEHSSGDVSNIREYGFAFIETDAENVAGSEISQGKQQRQVSKIELSESDEKIQSEIVAFAREVGFEFNISHSESMFAKGMGISDGIYHMKLDGERLRLELTEDGKEQQKRELQLQQAVISNKYQQRCLGVLARVNKLTNS